MIFYGFDCILRMGKCLVMLWQTYNVCSLLKGCGNLLNNVEKWLLSVLFTVVMLLFTGCSDKGGDPVITDDQSQQIEQNTSNENSGTGPIQSGINNTAAVITGEDGIRYLEELVEMCIKNGADFNSLLMYESENFWYSQAGAGVGSLRLAVERILWLRGEGENFAALSEGSRYTDWSELERMCPSSPYPWYFEGLIFDVQGKKEDADFCYAAAEGMYNYPDGGLDFHFLKDLPIDSLYTVRDRLRSVEDRLYAEYEPDLTLLEADPWNGRPDYLVAQIVVLTGDEKCADAMPYAEELVRMAPFEALNWYSAVVTAWGAGEPSYAVLWLREGLGYHPGDKKLLELYDNIAPAFEEVE